MEDVFKAAKIQTSEKLKHWREIFIEVAKEKAMKENGRLKPAENVEHSQLKYKTYKCSKCGNEMPVKNPEFGERKVCPYCDMGILEEVTDLNH